MSRGSMWGRFERYAGKTFGQAAAEYLYDAEHERQVKDLDRLASCVYNLSLYIANEPLIEVDEELIKPYKRDRLDGSGAFDKPAMPGTVNKEMRTLRAVLRYAARVLRWIPESPLIRDVKGPKKVAHPLSLIEKNRIFGALPEHWRNGAAQFALYTGVRRSELTSLKWEHMQPFNGRYIFTLVDTKNGKQRAVICNSKATEAVEYMRRWQADQPNELVFPSRLTGGEIKNVNGTWKNAWYAADMPRGAGVLKGWNTLRHTFASWLMACGVEDELRDKLMGHHQADIRYNYSQPALEVLFDAAETITDDTRIRGATILKAVPISC